MGKVWFVGAGPGDAELITVKGMNLLAQAGAILYAGSLVSEAVLKWASKDCEVADSKGMTLEQINDWLLTKAQKYPTVIRLQTGDPSLYGALVEMARPLLDQNIEIAVVPGVSSAMASAAAAQETLTLPEVTQTVILTRVEGRTPMPAGESIEELAKHRCTCCIFLSVTLTAKITAAFIQAGWDEFSPVTVVKRASWPDEYILQTNLKDLGEDIKKHEIKAQAMIIISPTLGAKNWDSLTKSKLYDKDFGHKFRKAE
ncbi:MAG: precorrin-4 C(11)-methyltransferase [SAR324 cluster bacterium]|nr:precorrin-4 C(11)-methyltransferase [SAR324 cluster bacterium]